MRADRQRNQSRILDAAREQISAAGPDVSMEQIAKAAGVAVGTLYRHYPTKHDLVRAVYLQLSATLIEEAQVAAAGIESPGDAMRGILRLMTDFVDRAAVNRGVKAAAEALGTQAVDDDLQITGRSALDTLVATAVADGDLRPTVTVSDFYLLMSSVPGDLAKPARDRWLQIVVDGLSAGPSRGPAPR
ncbi:TetR/AcrR family transcriptional regulator [Frondihabitans australicus]|uniref:TetR family transcriptional regulator n=1 Tax=Frondihabitans australicus TaxID=386892 RepID=A0A495IKZ1_9MICO|nr:TetR/AcrR family transcriptional regulator [Frondihabitans australicus]RKR75795.1 TetR family transcriptional regulator [Frondihabitans australicus]